MSILGLDIGTTGAKGVAFDVDGRPVATAYREYNMHSPRPGYLELNPNEVLDAVATVCRQIASATKNDPVRSVACSVLGEAITPVDARNRPLGNAIIGFDARGALECDELRGQISNVDVFRLTGHPINSFHTVFKLMHRRKHEPEVYARAVKWLGFQELVAVSLGAEAAVDYSAAARTLLLNTNTLTWCDRMLGLAGMSSDMFARPVAPGTPIGTVSTAGHERFGLPVGCVVAAGLHDQPAGILGAAVQPGESMYATGTVVCIGVLITAKPDPEVMGRCNLCCYPTYGKGRNVSLAWNFTGGSLLKWYRDNFAAQEVAEAGRRGVDPYDLILDGLPSDPTDLFVLPHFTTTGTPWLDTRALGAILGLRLTTRRGEIVKALLEGVEYEIALNQSLLAEAGIDIRLYKAIGGAAKSAWWMQLKADVLGRPVAVLETTESAALGVALLGARAANLVDSVSEAASRFARAGRTFEPDARRSSLYNKRLEIYRELYPTTRPLSHRISALAAEH